MALASVPVGRRIEPPSPNAWRRYRFEGITPERLSSIIKRAERGEVEEWCDLCSYMLRTDGHLRSVYETRIVAITSAEVDWKPSRENDPLALAGAEFCREALARSEAGWESLVTGLAHGEGIGWAAAQHVWGRVLGLDGVGEWHSSPKIIAPRDTEFAPDWTLRARSWADNRELWRSVRDEPAHSYIVHVPAKLDTPTVAGDLMGIAWLWLFKRWARIWEQTALERFASPMVFGKVGPNSTDAVRSDLRSKLEALSTEQVAVFEEGTSIEIREAAKVPAQAWRDAIDGLNAEITKALMGSMDVVDAEAGSYARAEVQFGATVMPRMMAIGNRLATTIERDWLKPLLQFNSHRFGGRVPPAPRLRFKLTQEAPPVADELAVRVGAVTYDEIRQARGFAPWGTDRGGAHKPASGPTTVTGERAENVQQTALNSAQIASLVNVVSQVSQGMLSRESALSIITTAFPIGLDEANAILGPINFEPAVTVDDAPAGGGAPLPFARSKAARKTAPKGQQQLPMMTPRPKTSPTSGGSASRTRRVPVD